MNVFQWLVWLCTVDHDILKTKLNATYTLRMNQQSATEMCRHQHHQSYQEHLSAETMWTVVSWRNMSTFVCRNHVNICLLKPYEQLSAETMSAEKTCEQLSAETMWTFVCWNHVIFVCWNHVNSCLLKKHVNSLPADKTCKHLSPETMWTFVCWNLIPCISSHISIALNISVSEKTILRLLPFLMYINDIVNCINILTLRGRLDDLPFF